MKIIKSKSKYPKNLQFVDKGGVKLKLRSMPLEIKFQKFIQKTAF